MPVIAMTREMGSGGREVAQRVADKTGAHGCSPSTWSSMTSPSTCTCGRAPSITCLEGGATLLERLQTGSKRLARYTTEEILDLANQGNVLIRGWGACVVLRDVPHVVRVRVCAPMEVRERAVMERSDIKDRSAARREIERNDAAHKITLQSAYGVDREDSTALRSGAQHRAQLDRDLREAGLRSRREPGIPAKPRPPGRSSTTRPWKHTFASSFANALASERASAASKPRPMEARSS